MPVLNREQLVQHGMGSIRQTALDVLESGLTASDPYMAVRQSVTFEGDILDTPAGKYDLREFRRVLVLGAGKASLPIARALDELLAERIAVGLVAVPEEQHVPLRHVEIITADHPFPTERSHSAGRRALAIAESAGEGDLLISCITGGSSAVLAAPPAGVSLADKARLHQQLLSCGAAIGEINTVRKHVSLVKGGRLAAAAAGASILNLTVSDAAGDALDLITDPTVPDTSTPEDAIALLKEWGLWEDVSPTIRAHLDSDTARAPALKNGEIRSAVLISGATVCAAMIGDAKQRGLRAISLGPSLEADGAHMGSILAQLGRTSLRDGQPFPRDAIVVSCGGESTVSLGTNGEYGLGGPNQELALAAALRLCEEDTLAVAAVDTDGCDGGTDHAGAIIDGMTPARALAQDLDLRRALREHRASAPLQALGDLVSTGPTGTNVNDLIVMVLGGRPS